MTEGRKSRSTNKSRSADSNMDETITITVMAVAKGLGVLVWWSVLFRHDQHPYRYQALRNSECVDQCVEQYGASPHTVAAYRDTWRLLLAYAAQTTATAPASLNLSQLDADLINGFLTALGNAAWQRYGGGSRSWAITSWWPGRPVPGRAQYCGR